MAISATAGVSVSLSNTETGLNVSSTGSAVLSIGSADNVAELTLPAATVEQSLALPVGVTTAQFAFVKAITGDDMKVQTSLAAGSTVYDVPAGGAMIFYNVATVYVSTVAGGKIQFIVGG